MVVTTYNFRNTEDDLSFWYKCREDNNERSFSADQKTKSEYV